MKENIARQLREDAIESGHPSEFRVGTERVYDEWLECIFGKKEFDEDTLMEAADPAFLDLVDGITIDDSLFKLYIAVSFSKASEEAIRRGLLKNRVNGIMRNALVKLSEKHTHHEIMQISNEFIEELRQEYRKSVRRTYSKKVNEAMEIINFGKFKKLSVAGIAGELGMDCSSLSRKFKRETGMTMTDYILSVKMKEAEKMQKKGIYSNEEICDALDFPSYAYFSRRYKQYFGCAPSKRDYD